MRLIVELVRSQSFGIFLSAFLGAFFAFLFTRLGTLADRLFARMQKHRTGLVAIEKQGNEYQNLVGDNLFVVNDYLAIAQKRLKDHQPFIYFNELHEFPVDRTIMPMLGNLDVVNDLFSFEASTVKVNASIRALNRFLHMMQEAYINKNIDLDTYLHNIEKLVEKFAEVAIFLNDLQQQNKELLAEARVLIKGGDRTLYMFLLGTIMKKKLTKRQRERIPNELKRLNQEIDATEANDRERIARLISLLKKSED